MSVTNRQRSRRWLVWEEDYAEEGSMEVHARTRRGAILEYLRLCGEHEVPLAVAAMALGVAPLTAGLAKLRERQP